MLSFTFLRRRRWAPLALAALSAAAIAGLVAPGAQAAFVTAPCQGSNIVGDGSSLQNVAQINLWDTSIFPTSCLPSIAPTVTYTGDGSGAGRKAMGSLDGNRTGANNPLGSRFAGTDDPPTPTEQAHMNNGPTAGTADDALIHIIPVASAAITVDVNVPNDCITHVPAAFLDASGRIKIPNATLVAMFSGATTTWGGATGVFGDTGDATCNANLVRRVVRTDSSGSTYVLKEFLNHVGGSFDLANNTAWPAGAGEDDNSTCQASSVVAHAANLCRSTQTGGGAVGTLISSTDGSIGYMDLATARGKGFDYNGTLAGDDQFWMALQSPGNAATYVEPTADANGFRSSTNPAGAGIKGANCVFTTYNHIPTGADPTIGDWSLADGTGAASGYPACTLTWDLAYDDDAAAYGASAVEEKLARTVKDFLTVVVSNAGQGQLAANDYAPLPNAIVSGSVAGVASIGWNKNAGGGGGPSTTTVTTAPSTPTTAPAQTAPVVTPPSNRFTITSSKVSSSKKLVISLQLPAGGKISIKGTAKVKGKTLTVASTTHTVGSGRGSITLSPSSATLAALKKVGSIRVTLTVTFTPTGGTAAHKTVTLTLKGKKTATHKKSKKH